MKLFLLPLVNVSNTYIYMKKSPLLIFYVPCVSVGYKCYYLINNFLCLFYVSIYSMIIQLKMTS